MVQSQAPVLSQYSTQVPMSEIFSPEAASSVHTRGWSATPYYEHSGSSTREVQFFSEIVHKCIYARQGTLT